MRALPPPLWLPRLKGTQWQAGSSRSLAASRKPASLPKVVVAAGSSLPRSRLKHVPDAVAAAAAAAAAVAAEPRKLAVKEGGVPGGGDRREQ